MKVEKTEIDGVLLIEPDVYPDDRGCFFETYQYQRYFDFNICYNFVQDNMSFSRKGVLRGLHYQVNFPQAKLVQIIEGEVFDVAVDLRRNSPTFKKWVGRKLSSNSFQQFFIPAGFAHGFYVLSDSVKFMYKCSQNYSAKDDRGIHWNDPTLNIDWPLIGDPLVSEKDCKLPFLEDIDLSEKIS